MHTDRTLKIVISLSKDVIEDPSILESISPDNDESISMVKSDDGYKIVLERVKISSIYSLTTELLQSIEISKKIWKKKM